MTIFISTKGGIGITLRDLTVFIAVCDCGSITAAAAKLRIAQPSVSQVIADIEAEYQVKLFERLSKKLYLTDEGWKLLNYARHITELFLEMERDLHGSGGSRVLRVGASVTIGTCLLSGLTLQYLAANPEIRLEAVVDNTRIIEELILGNRIDFGLVEGSVHHREIVSRPFMDDELVLVCGKSHPLYGRPAIARAELAGLQFIVREEGSGTRELFASVMAANAIPWRPAWVCNNAEGIKNSVSAGIGVSVISRLLVAGEVQSGALGIVRIDGLDFKRQFNLIYHKNKFLAEPIKRFFDICLPK